MTMQPPATPAALPPATPPAAAATPATPPAAEESFEAKVARIVGEQLKPMQAELHGARTRAGKAEAQVAAAGKDRGWSDDEIAEFRTAYASYESDIALGVKAGIPEKTLKALRPGAVRDFVADHLANAGQPAPTNAEDMVAKVLAALKAPATEPAKPKGAIGEPMGGSMGIAPTPMDVNGWASMPDTRAASPGERQANMKQVRDLLARAGVPTV